LSPFAKKKKRGKKSQQNAELGVATRGVWEGPESLSIPGLKTGRLYCPSSGTFRRSRGGFRGHTDLGGNKGGGPYPSGVGLEKRKEVGKDETRPTLPETGSKA